MTKLAPRAQPRRRYRPSAREPAEVAVPAMPSLPIDGAGDPRAIPLAEAIGALYAPAIHGARRAAGLAHEVMPPEGLWWVAVGAPFARRAGRVSWRWTAMILQPDSGGP